VIDLLATAVLACLSLWWLLALGLAFSRPWWRPQLLRTEPRAASNLLLAGLALTLLFSLAITLLLYLPHMRLVAAHCHAGNCASHMPRSGWWLAPALLLGMLVGVSFARFLFRQCLPARRLFRNLCLLGCERGGYCLLPDMKPAAFALGIMRPRVFFTRGLLDNCRAAEVDIILRHEHAHLRRRDNLRIFAAALFTLPLPFSLREPLLRDHRLLAELACDVEAATLHSREDVAATLLHVSRMQASVPAGARGFVGDTEARVSALLSPAAAPVPLRLLVSRRARRGEPAGVTATDPAE